MAASVGPGARVRRLASKVAQVVTISADPISALRFLLAYPIGPRQRTIGRFRYRGLPFFARLDDWVAVDEVVFRREYDVVEPLLAGHARPTVVDLGAHIGLFALRVFASRPDARVVSVEPGSSAFRLLELNRGANRDRRWSTHRFAVWDADGEVPFLEDAVTTHSRVGETTAGPRVPTITLATLLARHAPGRIDLLKMDVEGAESVALPAGERALDAVESLLLELHPAYRAPDDAVATLRRAFPFLYRVPRAGDDKPILVASRRTLPLPTHE